MKKEGKERLLEMMQKIDSSFKPKLNENIYFNKYNIKTIDLPIIGDAISILSKNNNAIKFTNKNEFVKFLNQQQYFSASYSHTFDSIENYEKGIPNDNSILLFETGHEIVGAWDDLNSIGYVLPEDDNKSNHNINENNSDEFIPISTPVGSEDDELFTSIVNQGIDSHLEGFTKSNFEVKPGSLGNRRIFNFHKSELPILLRRLEELGTEEALQWKYDIEANDTNLDEVANNLNTINPKYTHFAVLNSNGNIVNGWDYNGLDPDELKQFKVDYFFTDIKDMGFDPKTIGIYTKRTLEKRGINPFDKSNWN